MRPPKRRRRAWFALFFLVGASVLAQPAAAPGQKLRSHFDADALLAPPGFFDFVSLGAPAEAEWKVTAGTNPPSPPNQVCQVITTRPEGSIAAALRQNVTFRDGTISLALQKGSGRGGMVFRMVGEKEFRALLVDLTTGEARLTAYRSGQAVDLGQGKASLNSEWGFLSITIKGARIAAQWNGQPLLEAIDPHPTAGRVGMATAGTGMVSFDEFVLEPVSD